MNTEEFNQNSKGLLMMRLQFLVSTYLEVYVWDPKERKVVLGNPLMEGNHSRTVANRKSHLMTVDKLVG